MSPSDACVFDRIVAGELAAHLVLDEPDLVGFLDRKPVFAGHVLIVPRVHWPTIGELPEPLLAPLFDAGRRVSAAQRAVLGAEGTFFGLNDVVSQSVPHVHLHVIPRRKGDGLRGFFWPRTRYASEEEAEAVARRLRVALPAPGATRDPATTDGAADVAPHPGAESAATAADVTVRAATGADAAAIAGLIAEGSRRPSRNPRDPDTYRSAIEEIGSTPGASVLVAEVGGEVVGVCQLYSFRHLQERGGLCAEIESVHVLGRMRGRGIGGRLLEAAVDSARRLGCYRVQLTSHKSRTDAHRFYLAHGFEATHEGFKRYL